jgi:PAS domain-containing protein/DNA-binding CsgD family transcriptional regulator
MRDIQPDILAALYGGVIDPGRLDHALTLLSEEFDSPSIALLSVDPHAAGADVWASRGVFGRPEVLEAHRTFAAYDPAPTAFAYTPSLGATTTGIMIGQGRIREDDPRTRIFLNEFYRQIGLEECLGANLATRNGQTALIGIHRGKDRKAFTADEVALLEKYTPHLAQALQLRRTLGEARSSANLLAQAIDRIAAGIILRDREGRVVHCNRAVLEMAARGDGLSIGRDGFPFSAVPAATQALRRLGNDASAGGSGGVVAFPRKEAALPYTLLATPVSDAISLTPSPPGGQALLIVIHDPDARIETSVDVIAKAFGLPPRTAEMLLAMASGEDAAHYAERRGISGNAVKFHLRTAFARTGFRRQSDLLKGIMRALSDLGRRG